MSLRGKVCIVTGGSRGIGRAIALELAKEGASILINYSKDEEGALKTLDLIKECGGVSKAIKEDIASFEGCKRIVDFAIESFGKLDILVNNAGRSFVGLFMDMGKEDIDNIINTNLLGAMYLSKHAIGHMLNNGGSIINISSMWGDVGASCETVYSSSKGGLNLFTKALAKEMAPSKIRVNGISPGVIETDMNSFLSKEDRESLEEEIPIGRFGLPEEIAKAVVFLASSKASYITGQIIRIDGGMI